MVSLLELAQITEEGVKFRSPYDGSECMLTPEHSMEIQVNITFYQIVSCSNGHFFSKYSCHTNKLNTKMQCNRF